MELVYVTQGEGADGEENFLGYLWWCPLDDCPEALDYPAPQPQQIALPLFQDA